MCVKKRSTVKLFLCNNIIATFGCGNIVELKLEESMNLEYYLSPNFVTCMKLSFTHMASFAIHITKIMRINIGNP